jgi:hypothetical protein
MSKPLPLVLALMIWLAATSINASPMEQTAAPADYTGLNVLFVIDQSGSMGGVDYGQDDHHLCSPEGCDPLELRFAGPQFALALLSDLHSTAAASAKPEINFALMAFGSDTRPILDWVNIDTQAPGWQSELSTYISDLSAERFRGRNLRDTDFKRAVQQSAVYFKPPPGKPGIKYRNVIIILTDGAPCTGYEERFQERTQDGRIIYNCAIATRQPAMEAHLAELKSFVQANFPGDDYEFYVIGLDKNDQFWSKLESHWAEIVCMGETNCDAAVRHARVSNSNEIGGQMRLILSDAMRALFPNISPENLTFPPGDFVVKPYQQRLRIDIFKTEAEPLAGVTLTHNGFSQALPENDTSPIQTMIVPQPVPGKWNLNVPNQYQIVKVIYDTAPAAFTFDPAASGEIFSQIPLVGRLSQGDGSPLPADPADPYPLTVEARIYDATLIDRLNRPLISTVSMTRDPARPEMYQFTGAWLPETAGRYEVRVSATYVNSDGIIEVLVNDQTALDNLVVAGSYVEWSGVQPISERMDRPFTAKAVVRNVDNGNPIQNTGGLSLRFTVNREDGTPYQSFIVANQAQTPGDVQAQFMLPEPGSFSVQMEVGSNRGNGNFVVLPNASIPQIIQTRPVHPLSLRIVQPAVTTMEAQRIALSPRFEFNLNTPTTVQVGVYDDLTGNLVSLRDATGGAETQPRLVMNPDSSSPVDLTSQLIELQPGLYYVELPGLGMGNFVFAASTSTPVESLTGDYTWANAQTAYTLNRVLSSSVPLLIGGLVLTAVVIGGTGAFLYRRNQSLQVAPLRGKVVFAVEEIETGQFHPMGSIDLEAAVRNTQTFKQLFPPFEVITLTTRKSQNNSENGYAYIEHLRIDGKEVNVSQMLRPGEYITVYTSGDGQLEYKIGKDVEIFAGGDFFSGLRQ